jgi:hypothetical protein
VDSPGTGHQEVASCCVYGNEPLGYIKCGEFVYYLRKYELVKKNSTSGSPSVCMTVIPRGHRVAGEISL